MSYKQLIEGQRYQIQAYLSQHLSYREIGRRLNVSHSSISRELRRHTINGTYEPNVAQRRAQHRRHCATKSQISQKTINYVEFGLSLKWSPEQISGVSRLVGLPVSHEWIYGYVQRDKHQGGKLYKHLRHNGRRYRKGSRAKRVIIPNRIGIEERPEIVDTKQRLNFDVLDFGLLLGVISIVVFFFILLKMAHRLLIKPADLTIRVTANGLEYDSGITPLFIGFDSGYFDFWKSVFFKRQYIEFDSSEMKAIYLEEKNLNAAL